MKHRRETMNNTQKTSYATIHHVLIVDDEIEFVKTLKRHLKRQNFTLKTAQDGAEAIQLMARTAQEEEGIDLVVSDVVMPRMDGIQLLEEIKKQYPATSVLLLTGFGDSGMAGGVIREEMDDFHQKSITPQKMLSLIQHVDQKRVRAFGARDLTFKSEKFIPKKYGHPNNDANIPSTTEKKL